MHIPSHTFTGANPGPHLLIFGGIHGNEICGPRVLTETVQALQSGQLKLDAGKLTLVPLCNRKAYEQNARYVEKNLNRVFCRHEHPTCHEEELANHLLHFVEEADVLLDLHSFHTPGVPYAFRDYADPATRAFAAALGLPWILSGWPEVYAAAGRELNGGDTVSYAHSLGKVGVTVECGCHTEESSFILARSIVRNALIHTGLLPPQPAEPFMTHEVEFTDIILRPQGEGRFVRDWQNLDELPPNTQIAVLANGIRYVSPPHRSYIIMPYPTAQPGDEWYYLARPLP